MTVDVIEIALGPLTFTARAAGPPDGRLVLFLHGFPQSSFQWRYQMAAVAAAGYRAVAFDQRGYSARARPDGVEHYRLEHLVADALGVADEMGGHQVDLVGHDWGGAVAWITAANHPQRVRSLTAVSMPHPAAFAAALVAGDPDQVAKSSYLEMLRQEGTAEAALLAGDGAGLRGLFAATGHPDPDATGEYIALLEEPGALTAALNWYRAASFSDIGEGGKVAPPTLYVWGDADVALGRRAAEATVEHVEGPYRFEVLPGAGHWLPEEVPEQINLLLLEHLATHG